MTEATPPPGYRPPPAVPRAVQRPRAVASAVASTPRSAWIVVLAVFVPVLFVVAVVAVASVNNSAAYHGSPGTSPQIDERPDEPETPIDPGAGLPPAVPSTTITRTELEVGMQEFIRTTFAAADIDDPEIPDDLVYPLSYARCDAATVRGSVEVWFATADNERALTLVRKYWMQAGYVTTMVPNAVAGAGREPRLAETLSLDRVTWDDENLRLKLTSLCVLDQ